MQRITSPHHLVSSRRCRRTSGPLVGDADPETLTAPEVLGVMVEHFHPRLSLACSFQKEEAVLLDMLLAIAPDARVFALDTHVLFPETYDVWRAGRAALRDRGRGVPGPVARPAGGDPRRRAVGVQPVALLRDPQGRPARSTHSPGSTAGSRACAASSPPRAPNARKLGWDERHELWQANPLADWSDGRRRRLHRASASCR